MTRPDDVPESVLAMAEEAYQQAIYMTTEDEPKAMVLMVARAIMAAEKRGRELGRADSDRLDFLDSLNAALNGHYKTTYRWEMVINHNVNRLMLNFPRGVDLNDSKAHGWPSCRNAIDAQMARIAASRIATAIRKGS